MSHKQKKWMYIPIEIKVREIPAKLLLAAAAANAGYNVIFGRKSVFSKFMTSFPAGVYLAFGAQQNFSNEYKRLKSRGFSIAVMDEEGLVTFSDDMYKRLRLSEDTLQYVTHAFCWGKRQANIIRSIQTENELHVYETGNLRFDILRPAFRHLLEKDAALIKEKYGRIILINSSFGACNHFDGKEQYFQALKKKKILQNEQDANFYREYFSLKEDVFNKYLDVIPHIAESFPDHTIIVRPHPSENYEAWSGAAQGHENVKVVHEGSVHPWLIASDAVIHHFCTTALEAFVSDTPAIAYRPVKNDEIETGFVYSGSVDAQTPEEVLKFLGYAVQGEKHFFETIRDKNRESLSHYIASMDGSYAYQKILDAFDENPIYTQDGINMTRIHLRKLRTRIGDVYRFFKRGMKPHEKNYMDHKFSSLDEGEIYDIVQSINEALPDLEQVKVKKLDDLCFLMSAK